jgi:SAM-dependent methyltransferase
MSAQENPVAGGTNLRCPVCHATSNKPVLFKTFRGANLDHVGIKEMPMTFLACDSCGMVRTAPMPEEATHAALAWYEHLYKLAANEPCDPITKKRYLEWLDMLAPYRGKGRLFETGFGRGHFLRTAVEAGFTCAGNELSANACDAVRSFGVDPYCGDLSTLPTKGEHDLVFSLGVLEHVPDPDVQAKHYFDVLAPGGAVFITTPNVNSVARRLLGAEARIFDIEHLFYFSPRTMERMLTAAGFEIVRCWTKNIDVPELINGLRPQRLSTGGQDIDYMSVNQSIRGTLEARGPLRKLKGIVNSGISALGVGEELYAIAKTPVRSRVQ